MKSRNPDGRFRNHNQPVAGNGDVYVLEVMFTGTANDDGVERHFVLWNPVAALAAGEALARVRKGL